MRGLLSFGAWITVSNVVGPLMVSFDRFIIGGLISVALVTYYVTPYQVATQFLILPTALSTVLFPAFATLWEQDRVRLHALYANALRLTLAVMMAAAAVIIAVAPTLLTMWLGPRFAGPSTTPLRWLMAGVMLNGVAQLSFTLIQSAGRSDWTAKLHLAEAPLYVVTLVVCAKRFGLNGVAVVWCLRAAIDLIVLYLLAAPLGQVSGRQRALDAAALAVGLVSLVAVSWSSSLAVRCVIAVVVMVACLAAAYSQVIAPARNGLLRSAAAPSA
jgi:O-antigen/teichoic acid export membrane protein